MQHAFGALTQYFRLIRLRNFRGQQPARPEGDGKTQVVSTKCLMSLNGHLLRPRGTSPPCFSFSRFIVEQCLLKKTSFPAHSLKTTRSSYSAQYPRHQTYSDALKNSFFPKLFHTGIVCLLLWPMSSPQRSSGHSLFKKKIKPKFFYVFFVLFCCFCSALDKLLGQLGIYATWLSSFAYLQKQLHIFIFFFMPHFFSVIT